MASDDDDDSLVQFLESEVFSGISDQEEEKREVFDEEDDDSVAMKMLITDGNTRDEIEEEEREAIRKQIEEEDISEEAEMRKEEEENEEEEEKKVNKMLIEDDICGEEEEGEGDEREMKRRKVEEVDIIHYGESKTLLSSSLSFSPIEAKSSSSKNNKIATDYKDCGSSSEDRGVPRRIENGIFSKVPPELFRHILKFLSSEDLIACSLVCRFLNYAASDESLWRRLYCMRWGLLPPDRKLRECAWKKLYIQRDEEDLVELVRNCPSDFKEYYIQMQAAKRSQAPLPSQVLDDQVILDKTVSDQVSMWKTSRGLTDTVVLDHACSGDTCTYYQIGDVFLCEKTGNVHVCDDTCREVVADPSNELLVCTISGRCFDRLLSPSEIEPDVELLQGGITDEAEPFMGSGRFARAYLLGYNCADEKELEDTLRFC